MYAQDLQGGEGCCTFFTSPTHEPNTSEKLSNNSKLMLTEPNSFPSYVGEKKV